MVTTWLCDVSIKLKNAQLIMVCFPSLYLIEQTLRTLLKHGHYADKASYLVCCSDKAINKRIEEEFGEAIQGVTTDKDAINSLSLLPMA